MRRELYAKGALCEPLGTHRAPIGALCEESAMRLYNCALLCLQTGWVHFQLKFNPIFILFVTEIPSCKQCRSWSGSALFTIPFMGHLEPRQKDIRASFLPDIPECVPATAVIFILVLTRGTGWTHLQNEWMIGRLGGCLEWMNEWMNERPTDRMIKQTNEMNEWMNEWIRLNFSK